MRNVIRQMKTRNITLSKHTSEAGSVEDGGSRSSRTGAVPFGFLPGFGYGRQSLSPCLPGPPYPETLTLGGMTYSLLALAYRTEELLVLVSELTEIGRSDIMACGRSVSDTTIRRRLCTALCPPSPCRPPPIPLIDTSEMYRNIKSMGYTAKQTKQARS
jgi:hypothetical protein